MNTKLTIVNNGEELQSTNFWQHQLNTEGKFFLTWNKGVGRLLIPDSHKNDIQTMASAANVIGQVITEGEEKSLQLLFDDHSHTPYQVKLNGYQSDRAIPDGTLSTVLTAWYHEKKRFTLKLQLAGDLH